MSDQPTPEQIKAFQEKLAKLSPEERKAFFRQQCVFCQIVDGKIDSMKVFEDGLCIGVLDINPANPGHVLLLPKEHFQVGPQVPESTMRHMGMVAKAISNACLKVLKCGGTTIFVANGMPAGQRAQHFMVHIIPRKEKDGHFEISENGAVDDGLADNLRVFIEKKLGIKVESTAKKEEKNEAGVEEPEDAPRPVKEKGYIYFVDEDGDVSRCRMVKGRVKEKQKKEKVLKVGIKRQPNTLYFVDNGLNIRMTRMNRSGRKKAGKEKRDVEKKSGVGIDDIARLFTK
jgi:histidine triad (HIT) family protein